jgi:hypothetical protein
MSHCPLSCTDNSTWIKFGTENFHEGLSNFKFCENTVLGGRKLIHSSKLRKHILI